MPRYSLLHEIMQVFFILLKQVRMAELDFSTEMEGSQLGPHICTPTAPFVDSI